MTQRAIKTRERANKDGDSVNDGDKVWVTVTRVANLGNFESYKIEAGYSKTIQAGDNPMELMREMEAEIAPFVNTQARLLKKKKRNLE